MVCHRKYFLFSTQRRRRTEVETERSKRGKYIMTISDEIYVKRDLYTSKQTYERPQKTSGKHELDFAHI